ncbi:hypothetical protein AB0H83_04365 [Dactylosporangium sp. NPDC050688]|uniref:hypothetical protein n=1 Tax=Dactylosporangium sp. NPDC050688 TaxID=3157217 RepID=UPI0033FEFDDA
MALEPYPTTDPPARDRHGRGGALWLSLDAAGRLAAAMDRGGPGGDLRERLARAAGGSTRDGLVPWCVRAGVPFDARRHDGRRTTSVHRGHPILVTEEAGRRRILLLEFWDSISDSFGFRFSEVYDHPTAGRHTFDVDTARRAIVLFGRSGVDGHDGEVAAVAAFRARVAAGELGPHLPPGGNRDLVERWITPYTSIRRLNELLGAAPGADPQARLARGFRDLVERGEIGDGLPLRQARDRVQALFAEAGVPAEPADSHWISSD